MLIDRDNETIENIHFVGNGVYSGRAEKACIRVHGKNCTIRNITGDGVECLIIASAADGLRIENCHLTGYMKDKPRESAAHHTAILVKNSNDVTIENCSAINAGSVVLAGSTPERLTIRDCKATNCWDNGIYLSSANHALIENCIIETVQSGISGSGSGIKVRGSHNRVTDCIINNVGIGVVVSPRNNTEDSIHCIVDRNTVGRCNWGIGLDNRDDKRCINATIAGNVVDGYVVGEMLRRNDSGSKVFGNTFRKQL
jgi:parallel beta-helix repeat protein